MRSDLINSAMRSGLTLGVLFAFNFLLSVSDNVLLGLLSYVMIAVILYRLYRLTVQYRERELFGAISFRHAFFYVLLLFVFASIISAFIKYFYLKYVPNDFLLTIYNRSLLMLQSMAADVTDEMRESLQMFTTPRGYTVMVAWVNMLIALLIAPVVAAIVRRDKSRFEHSENE